MQEKHPDKFRDAWVALWDMGFWVREPHLAAGDEVAWRGNANREQTPRRQVGGRLFLTNRQIIFSPNRFDDCTGGRSWSSSLKDVVTVSVEPSRPEGFLLGRMGQLRRRLRMECRDGSVELFVVNQADQAAARVQGLLAATNGTRD